MLNTLANHGFLPHDGKDITEEDTIRALGEGLNFDEEISRFLHEFAASTNPLPNATIFNLDHLGRHNVLEHDASLSRSDAFFANPSVFNQTVFDQTRSYWKGPVLSLNESVISRLARLEDSQTNNPNYTLSHRGDQFGLGEMYGFLPIYFSYYGSNYSLTLGMAERLTWLFSAILLQLQRPKDLSNTSLVNLSVKTSVYSYCVRTNVSQ